MKGELAIDPQESLNGAQVTAILEIVNRIRVGSLSKSTAEKIIATSFPVSELEARALISEVTEGDMKEELESGSKLQPDKPGPNPKGKKEED